MKVLIAFFICIVAVFGGEKLSEGRKRANELLKESAAVCVQELKLDPHIADETPCYYACVDQKLSMMNEDGTYNLERILSFVETAEDRQRMENMFNTKMKDCFTIIGKNPCKMAACVHNLPKSYYLNKE